MTRRLRPETGDRSATSQAFWLPASFARPIAGLGFDVCDHERILSTWQRFGARFLQRVMTESEWQRALRLADGALAADANSVTPPQAQRIAGRLARLFAAKEAAAKALGTGLAQGVTWRSVEVVHNASGAPGMQLHGQALAIARALTQQSSPLMWISLSSEEKKAYAMAVLTAVEGPAASLPP